MPRPPTSHCNRCNGPKRLGKKCYTCKRKWHALNYPDYHLRYYEEHGDVIRERTRQWKRDNRERVAVQRNRRRALKAGALGSVSAEEWLAVVKRQNGCCYDCGKSDPLLTMGHAIPLYKGGMHVASNIIAQCRSCNARQGKRIHRDFGG